MCAIANMHSFTYRNHCDGWDYGIIEVFYSDTWIMDTRKRVAAPVLILSYECFRMYAEVISG